MAGSELHRVATELRRKAELCRRAASVSTEGGHRADSILMNLAAELEREAQELEELPRMSSAPRDADLSK